MARDGKPVAVIVAQGNAEVAAALQEYVKQRAGGVETIACVGDRAIVLLNVAEAPYDFFGRCRPCTLRKL